MRKVAGILGLDADELLALAGRVTCEKPYGWSTGSIELTASPWHEGMGEAAGHSEAERFRVAAYDFGIKHNILRLLVDLGCDVTVVPATTSPMDSAQLRSYISRHLPR